jgi:hypothetical protein
MNDYISYFVVKVLSTLKKTISGSGRLKKSRVTDYASPVLLSVKPAVLLFIYLLYTNNNKVTFVHSTTTLF